jgi:hypothetical protein
MGSSYSKPSSCYIIALEASGGPYYFQFMPESITDSKSANFTDYSILGRSHPIKGYQNSPSRSIEFSVMLFAQPTAQDSSYTVSKVKKDVDFLLSLPYPRYDGGIKPPPKCHVKIGNNIEMIGVCTSASASYRKGVPWSGSGENAHGVEVSLRFEEVGETPIGQSERSNGKYAE